MVYRWSKFHENSFKIAGPTNLNLLTGLASYFWIKEIPKRWKKSAKRNNWSTRVKTVVFRTSILFSWFPEREYQNDNSIWNIFIIMTALIDMNLALIIKARSTYTGSITWIPICFGTQVQSKHAFVHLPHCCYLMQFFWRLNQCDPGMWILCE